MPDALPTPSTAVVLEEEPHRDLKRTGQPIPPNWREMFLKHYEHYGTYWKACKAAGISARTVERYRAADPIFNAEVEEARQEFADSQELSLMRIGQDGNPVGPIVLLKKHRPHEYIEKSVSLTLTATTELASEDGKALLLAMLGQGQTMTPLPEGETR